MTSALWYSYLKLFSNDLHHDLHLKKFLFTHAPAPILPQIYQPIMFDHTVTHPMVSQLVTAIHSSDIPN